MHIEGDSPTCTAKSTTLTNDRRKAERVITQLQSNQDYMSLQSLNA
jgi:hypothetical protein